MASLHTPAQLACTPKGPSTCHASMRPSSDHSKQYQYILNYDKLLFTKQILHHGFNVDHYITENIQNGYGMAILPHTTDQARTVNQ